MRALHAKQQRSRTEWRPSGRFQRTRGTSGGHRVIAGDTSSRSLLAASVPVSKANDCRLSAKAVSPPGASVRPAVSPRSPVKPAEDFQDSRKGSLSDNGFPKTDSGRQPDPCVQQGGSSSNSDRFFSMYASQASRAQISAWSLTPRITTSRFSGTCPSSRSGIRIRDWRSSTTRSARE